MAASMRIVSDRRVTVWPRLGGHLDCLTLVAGGVLPRALDSLPATKTRMPFVSVRLAFSATERHAVQRKMPGRVALWRTRYVTGRS